MSKPDIMSTDPKSILAWLRGREIRTVQRYLSGNPDRKKESTVRWIMIALIESEGESRFRGHQRGIELGRIDYGYYKREKRRRKKRAEKKAKELDEP